MGLASCITRTGRALRVGDRHKFLDLCVSGSWTHLLYVQHRRTQTLLHTCRIAAALSLPLSYTITSSSLGSGTGKLILVARLVRCMLETARVAAHIFADVHSLTPAAHHTSARVAASLQTPYARWQTSGTHAPCARLGSHCRAGHFVRRACRD